MSQCAFVYLVQSADDGEEGREANLLRRIQSRENQGKKYNKRSGDYIRIK